MDTRVPTPNSRRVVVKARFVKLTAHGPTAAAMHLRYIQRDGVEQDGRPGILYGPDGPVDAATFEKARRGEKHQFRLIVSPEDARDLDLTHYITRLMRQVEKDTGRPLEWAAVNHHNTDHPHAHVVVRGVDRRGREVRFDRDYVGRGLRGRAQELATQELGPRSPEAIRRARQREITQDRLTSLDQELERRAKDGVLTRADLEKPRRGGLEPPPLVARLEHLEGLRLAERTDPRTWTLAPDWKQRLRDLGERHDIIKQMHHAMKGDPSRYRIVRSGQSLRPRPEAGHPPRPIPGCIRAKALADELGGAFCAVVEAPDGVAYHVPLDARTAASCRVGDTVTVATVPRSRVRPEDAALKALATAQGGGWVPAPDHPTHAALVRRLRQLETLGLARRDGTAWHIDPGLVHALERLDRERPEFRLVVRADGRPLDQQVSTRGPVWLDTVDPTSLAPSGFGAELRPRLEERARVLGDLGIDPNDPRRVARLRELERRTLGECAAAVQGLSFLSKVPDDFRGRVLTLPNAPAYASVSDGQRLVVLPMNRELRAQEGNVVTLSRAPSGKLRVMPFERDRGR